MSQEHLETARKARDHLIERRRALMGDIARGDMPEKKAGRVASAIQQALEAAEAAIKHEEGLIAGNMGPQIA